MNVLKVFSLRGGGSCKGVNIHNIKISMSFGYEAALCLSLCVDRLSLTFDLKTPYFKMKALIIVLFMITIVEAKAAQQVSKNETKCGIYTTIEFIFYTLFIANSAIRKML